MNNREIFEVAEIEVIAFDAEDIIKTSTGAEIFPGEDDTFGDTAQNTNMFGHFVRP